MYKCTIIKTIKYKVKALSNDNFHRSDYDTPDGWCSGFHFSLWYSVVFIYFSCILIFAFLEHHKVNVIQYHCYIPIPYFIPLFRFNRCVNLREVYFQTLFQNASMFDFVFLEPKSSPVRPQSIKRDSKPQREVQSRAKWGRETGLHGEYPRNVIKTQASKVILAPPGRGRTLVRTSQRPWKRKRPFIVNTQQTTGILISDSWRNGAPLVPKLPMFNSA